MSFPYFVIDFVIDFVMLFPGACGRWKNKKSDRFAPIGTWTGRHKDICGLLGKWRGVEKEGVSPDSLRGDLLVFLRQI